MTKDFTQPTQSAEGRYQNFGAEPPQSFHSSHPLLIGYILWIFGFLGAHRFYYGRPISGTIWFLTSGLLFIGWAIDLFLIPSMRRSAEQRFRGGVYDYTVAFLLLTFLGAFGVHRFYLGKIGTGLLYLCTLGFLGLGVLYDFWTLNEQVDYLNRKPV